MTIGPLHVSAIDLHVLSTHICVTTVITSSMHAISLAMVSDTISLFQIAWFSFQDEVEIECGSEVFVRGLHILCEMDESWILKEWKSHSHVACRNELSKDGWPTLNGVTTLYELFESSVSKFSNNKCLGWRPIENGHAGDYKWHTYKETQGMHLFLYTATD